MQRLTLLLVAALAAASQSSEVVTVDWYGKLPNHKMASPAPGHMHLHPVLLSLLVLHPPPCTPRQLIPSCPIFSTPQVSIGDLTARLDWRRFRSFPRPHLCSQELKETTPKCRSPKPISLTRRSCTQHTRRGGAFSHWCGPPTDGYLELFTQPRDPIGVHPRPSPV